MLVFFGFLIGLDTADDNATNLGNTSRYQDRQQIAVPDTDFEADLLEALEHGHERNRECREENVDRLITFRFLERVFLAED